MDERERENGEERKWKRRLGQEKMREKRNERERREMREREEK